MGLFTERDEETPNQIILGKLNRIEAKLDEVIKALHEYDDESYGESSFEAFKLTNDYISSFNVDGAERRMDIIGQNGNEGLHYYSHHVTNEEADEDANNKIRVDKGKDSNNTQPKQKQYYKNKRSKRSENKH